MIIGGLEKLTVLDYPGYLAAIVFTQGCNFRCHYCYNPLLVWPEQGTDGKYKEERGFPDISEKDLFLFLEERKGKLDAVVITGGEPTLHVDLPEFIGKIKKMGYLVKLDTNGTNPEMVQKLIDEKLIDYIAMDLKAPCDRYEEVIGVDVDCYNILKNVKIMKSSGLPYEFRTTVVPSLLSGEDFESMGKVIEGAEKWYLQKFKSDVDLVDSEFKPTKVYTDKDMDEFAKIGQRYVKLCEVRD